MTTGVLGQSNPTASTNTTVYTVPSSVSATFNVSIVNTGTSMASVNLAISASGTPAVSEYIEYGTVIPAGSVLERGGLVAQTSKNVVVNCSTASCAVSVYGFEQ
jgi:hypothetical protein